MFLAQVVVDIPARELERPFSYAIPDELVGDVQVGSCVLVDFANRPAVAYVVGVGSDAPEGLDAAKLKPVQAILGGPYFSEASARVAAWIASEYLAPLSEAVRLFTPPGGTPRAVREETDDGAGVWSLKRPDVGPVDDRWVSLTPAAAGHEPRANATMQKAVLSALSGGPLRVAELAADLGSVDGAIKALSEAGVVQVEYRRRDRSAHTAPVVASIPRRSLTDGQSRALDAIRTARDSGHGVVVLDGITGSGKTEVYLQAIQDVIEAGKSALVLVPEIALTPQTVGRFRSRFGDSIAVLHSRLSSGERFDQWDRIASGEVRVVVGARSALFAPLADIGLIVIDEEHEPSYKQSSSPRYHARDVAVRIAREVGATLVLGSATPSLETLAMCEAGEWVRVEMPERATGASLPDVAVVDMTAEFDAGHRSMFSRPLIAALEEVVSRGEQAVLFLNRRGFASFLLCRECGHVPMCESCSTSMTYHEHGGMLQCHHCGATRTVPSTCPECDSPYLRKFGTGTQRVETEIAALLPDVPIVRMDADTTKGKGAHERLLARFADTKPGILLGTQMIAKGLDFPDVTLVGVINADTTLGLPDFRAGERSWQLLEQVAGRSGRADKPGRVVIQTYWPDHPSIRAVASHDASLFRDIELDERSELGYPPYGRLANILIRGEREDAVISAAHAVADTLKEALPSDHILLGPSAAVLARLQRVHRWHVLVKAPREADLPGAVAGALAGLPRTEGVTVVVDIDPVNLF